jgi:hypothetical protein
MRHRRALVWATCLLMTSICVAQKPEATVRAEIQRNKAIVAKANDAGTWKEIKPMVTETLNNSEAALDRGRLYLSLMELGRSERLIVAASYGDTPEQEEAAFERQWTDERARLLKYTSAENAPREWKAPLAVHALEEGARGQVMPTIDAAKAYAPVTELKYGQHYMGEAHGLADFSRSLREMEFAAVPSSPKVRSVAPELSQLQRKANAAFKPPLSREKHSEFIRLNSMLKLSGELDSAHLYAGAWYAYLLAVTQYSALNAQPIDAAKRDALRERAEAELRRPAESGSDDSLRRMFVEQAAAALEKSAPTADDLGRANAILNDVLPAYAELERGTVKMAPTNATQLATVTLVRWPYT